MQRKTGGTSDGSAVSSRDALPRDFPNTVRLSLCKGDNGFLLLQGEGQDEGKKDVCSLFGPLTRSRFRVCCPLPVGELVLRVVGGGQGEGINIPHSL